MARVALCHIAITIYQYFGCGRRNTAARFWHDNFLLPVTTAAFRRCSYSFRVAGAALETCSVVYVLAILWQGCVKWWQCGKAVILGIADLLICEGFAKKVVISFLRGKRGMWWHACVFDRVWKIVLCDKGDTFAFFLTLTSMSACKA